MKQKSNLPLVSVIMPVYNAGEFLVDAIESILKQTYRNFELIIIDDASIDNSWNIISKFKYHYPDKIKAIRLKNNLNKGGDACANIGFAESKGIYVCRMDADDVAHPERLSQQVEYLNRNQSIMILGTQAYVINKTGQIIGIKKVPLTHDKIYQDFFIFHPLIHPTIMIRKDVLPNTIKLYQIKYSANNDLLTFMNLLNIGKFANLNQKLLYYRIHGKNDSLIKPKNRFLNTFRIRLIAVKNGYRPTLLNIFLNVIQIGVILLLPEKLIVPIYLYIKGIVNINIFDYLSNKVQLPLIKLKSYLF